MRNYRIEEEHDRFGRDYIQEYRYYRNNHLIICKDIFTKEGTKINVLVYHIDALDEESIRDFYSQFYILHSNNIVGTNEKFHDEDYLDTGKIYDEYILYDLYGNTISIVPNRLGRILVKIYNASKPIDIEFFDNIVFSSCEKFKEFNEYEGPKLR